MLSQTKPMHAFRPLLGGVSPPPLRRGARYALLAVILSLMSVLSAQAQVGPPTNDPLVSQQRYPFDVHRIDKAWIYTTGSPSTKIGVFSLLGFTYNHEDLAGSRLLTPARGDVLFPKLGYGTELVGIVGATTNNSIGMAGIDRAASLRSYGLLADTPSGELREQSFSYQIGGVNRTFYARPSQFNTLVNQGRADGLDVYLFGFGVPTGRPADFPFDQTNVEDLVGLPIPPDAQGTTARELFQSEAKESLKTMLTEICFGLGCFNPPDPFRSLYESLGFAVQQDRAVIVGPSGDLPTPGAPSTPALMPELLDRYSITVGGATYRNNDPTTGELVTWDRSRRSSFVDVAGYAEQVVGLSAESPTAYNLDFGGTAAAAAIGAGVAGLLKAAHPSLTGEDIGKILRRTARDADVLGFDTGTGAGTIDAEAALAYVTTRDVQQAKVRPDQVIAETRIREGEELKGFEFARPSGVAYRRARPEGDLYRFYAFFRFTDTFRISPNVWIRWGQSDGYQSIERPFDEEWRYDPLTKDLRVHSITGHGIVVEGYYWKLSWKNTLGGTINTTPIPFPSAPSDFEVAYTAIGKEGTPFVRTPTNLRVTNPNDVHTGAILAWDGPLGGGSTGYNVYRSPGPNGPWTEVAFTTQTSWTSSVILQPPGTGGTADTFFRVTSTDGVAESPPSNTVSAHGKELVIQPSLATALPTEFGAEAPYPSPARTEATLRVALPEAANVRVTVYDVIGRRVAQLPSTYHEAGYHDLRLDTGAWASGVYLCRVEAGSDFAETRRLTVVR